MPQMSCFIIEDEFISTPFLGSDITMLFYLFLNKFAAYSDGGLDRIYSHLLVAWFGLTRLENI